MVAFFVKSFKEIQKNKENASDEYIDLLKKYIDAISEESKERNEEIIRILFYDCYPFKQPLNNKKMLLPISKEPADFSKKTSPLSQLGEHQLIALRTGQLRFRGYRLKDKYYGETDLKDSFFKPVFEQKAVDVKIAVDMMIYSINKLVDKITLITNDTDFIPAIKEARRNGLQIETVSYNGYKLHSDIVKHSDFIRKIEI